MPKRQRVQESTDSGEDCRLWWHCGEDEWYAASVQHWNARDVDVLGGLDVNNVDIEGSLSFLQEALGERWTAKGDSDPPPMPGSYALDVGAGCGRVTGGLLLRAFERVHMLEVHASPCGRASHPHSPLTNTSLPRESIGLSTRPRCWQVSDSLLAKAARALVAHSARLDTTRASLASFRPPLGVYDAIWAQWILGHLTDTSVVQLLRACRAALKPGGFIIVKENNAPPRLCSEGNGRYLIDQVAPSRPPARPSTLPPPAGPPAL
jgi:protein N-terminal methyltransferase